MREGQKTFTARRLRRDETPAEKRLWEQLRNRNLGGHKFVRQSPVGPYVADFLCREHALVVEVDGATHSTPAELESDRTRTRYIEAQGFQILRLQNDEILNGMEEALTIIRSALVHVPSPPPSLRDGSPSSPASGRGHADSSSSPVQREKKGTHCAAMGEMRGRRRDKRDQST
jgi:very-short-patch-repair endonuclease